ncbi:MAG: GDSL-type esterase/lipase family protein [Thiolinea sp.]
MKRVLAVVFLLSLLGNIGLLWFGKQQYQQVNAIRLDPLQLAVYPQVTAAKTPGIRRVVFYGDSRALGWPAPLVDKVEFLNRGIGQQTSEQVRLRFQQHVASLQASLVVVQMCVNDLKTIPLFPQRRDEIVASCKSHLADVIRMARATGSEVLLTTVFPLGKFPERWLVWSDAVAPAVQEVNRFILAQVGAGVSVLDAFSLLQDEKGQVQPDYSRDLLHLNARGYEVLNTALSTWLMQHQWQ